MRRWPVEIRYDPEADAVFVELREHGSHTTGTRLDERRIVHYSDDGEPVAVELLFVSEGIDCAGLPKADGIREALRSLAALAPT
jgi:uncharacterized protein YuzE